MNNSLAEVHPELVSEWSEKNLTLTPDDITFGSNKKVWWRGACGHEWQASVKVSITLRFCTFFTLKKCTDITVFSLRVIHLFPLVDNFHQQSLLLWNDEGFYQVLPLIWYYLGICPAILRSFCLL